MTSSTTHCRTCQCSAPPVIEVQSSEPGAAVVKLSGSPYRFTWPAGAIDAPSSATWQRSPGGRWELVTPDGHATLTAERARP